MSDAEERLEELEALLEELKPYSGFILSILEENVRKKTFFMMRYAKMGSEGYYNEVVALKKIINILRFILK